MFRRVSPSQGSLTNYSGDIFGVPGQWVGNAVFFSGKFGDSENLWKLPIGKWKVTAAPQRLTFGAMFELQPTMFRNMAAFAVVTANMHVATLGIQSSHRTAPGELLQLTTGAGFDFQPSISRDGKRLVFISDRSGNRDVWLKDLETGQEIDLTPTPQPEGYPRISPDGSRVAYRIIENRRQVIYIVSAQGGKPEKVCDDCGLPTDWSPNGQLLLFEPGSRIPAVGLLNLASRQKREIVKDARRSLRGARFSPDGRWIAFHCETGPLTRAIYIVPFRMRGVLEEKDWAAVTDGAGIDHNPCWSPDGKLLYFLSERDGFRCIFGQRLQSSTPHLVGDAFAVHHFHAARRSLLRNVRANPSQVGLSATPGRLVFSLDELAGNIWMTKIESRN
jgi:Tol biopolymer transport system component